jgi:hypothetical protein
MGALCTHSLSIIWSNLMLERFDPVQFSTAENQFLLDHVGEPSVVALRSIKGVINPQAAYPGAGRRPDSNPIVYPDGVIPASVKPVLDGVYELLDLEKRNEIKWIGLEAFKNAIKIWFKENQKWANAHKRNAKNPRWPSLYSFDAKGNARLGGPGSDSGQVRTYFGPAGERIPFAVDLLVPEFEELWEPPKFSEAPSDPRLFVDLESHRIECKVPLATGGFCGHTESYKVDSRASYNAARARMSRHLRKANVETEAHRELQTLEFGS